MSEELQYQSERIKRLHSELNAGETYVDIQRARYFTESFKETEGQPIGLRFAKALYHIAESMEIHIENDQLLVGSIGGPERYGVLYPELDGCFLSFLREALTERQEASFILRDEDREYLINEVAPYWKDKSFYDDYADSLPEDVYRLTYTKENRYVSKFLVNETVTMRSASQWVLDFETGIRRGFASIKKEAEDRLKELQEEVSEKAKEQRMFWEEILIVSDAIVLFANRFGDKAEQLALEETDVIRAEELRQIARIAHKVPEYPAETFYEALQAQYFIQMFSRLEQKTGATISNGRMDQYLYPYYKKDMEAGILTDEKVKELFSCMWIGMAHYRDLYVSPAGGSFNNGYSHWEAVTIGGVTPDGMDATNELSYLLLENKRELPLDYPDLAARIHLGTPDRFLYEIAETIKKGTGHPKLLNDEEIIPLYLAKGANIAEANDYAVSGCTETRLVNRETLTTPSASINAAALIELTLRNGRMLKYGDELLSIETGEAENFESWEEFYEAFQKQAECFVRTACRQLFLANQIRAKHFGSPLGSALHGLCRKYAMDLHSEQIPEGLNLGFFDIVGFASTIDSLSAIRENVYKKKITNISELRKAMDANFEGYEVLHQRLLHSPCYGNNDAEVDTLAKEFDLLCSRVAEEEAKAAGGTIRVDVRYVPASANVALGRVVSALPDGRLAWTALSDGTSAAHGADVNGPTAVLLSNYYSKNYGLSNRAARLLNLKFTPASLAGDAGTKRLMQFIKSWRDLKLWHIQFNVIDQETLLAAQKNPDQYRNLIIRVAGYSAYFVNLSKDLQDDIIRRTSHATVA